MSEVKSLSELPYWGGGFPADHEFSTLEQIKQWNSVDPEHRYDEALVAADALVGRWTDPSVRKSVGLYLHGRPGNGKTHFAVALGRELAERDVYTAYLHLPSISPYRPGTWDQMSQFRYSTKNTEANVLPNSIFSDEVYVNSGIEGRKARGKSALILDDYRPEFQRVAFAAIEAAAERGGLVVITSNHTDPFGLLSSREPVRTDAEIAMRSFVEHANPDAVANEDLKRAAEAATVSASLASRMATMFKLVGFSGPDMRVENSFWG